MRDILAEIRERLSSEHPELRYTIKDRTITVNTRTADGFDVSLTDGGGFTVGYGGGWHEHLISQDDAMACFWYQTCRGVNLLR